MNTNIQMSEAWASELHEHGISSLQLERILHLYKGSPHEVRLNDILTGNTFLMDIDNRSRAYISLRQRIKAARERIFVTSYIVPRYKRKK